MEIFNRMALSLTLIHAFVMMYSNTWKVWVNVGINVAYTVMFSIRVSNIGGFRAFIQDVRGSAYTLQNRVRLVTSTVGLCGAFLYVISQITDTLSSSEHVFKGMMVIPLWQLLVMTTEFRNIMESFALGLHKITSMCILLFVVFYFFSFVAHSNFKDLHYDVHASEFIDFTTFGNSCLTLFQVFIGAG